MARPNWPRKGLWVLGVLGLCTVLFEIYARFPSNADVSRMYFPEDTTALVLLFHGTGGRDEPMLREIAQRFASGSTGTVVLHYVWSPYSDDRLRASAHGEHIGGALGRELAGLERLAEVRLIAHSAGAYIPDPLCRAYKAAAANPARIEMTFVDPIGIKGSLDFGFGYRNYGRCADFSAAYINTDDIVPGTNAPLRHAYNLDVTKAAARANFAGRGHLWPVRYFLDHITAAGTAFDERNHDTHPRGAVEPVD